MQMKDICLEGNLVDNGWIENLKYDNGKTNLNAVMILSEIVYWYRPMAIRDEFTGQVVGYKKKFAADKLQMKYETIGNRLGLTKRQVKDACDFLRNRNLITIEFRTVETSLGRLPNVMYIELVIDNLKKITGINRVVQDDQRLDADHPTFKRNNSPEKTEDAITAEVISHPVDNETITVITPEIIPESETIHKSISNYYAHTTENKCIDDIWIDKNSSKIIDQIYQNCAFDDMNNYAEFLDGEGKECLEPIKRAIKDMVRNRTTTITVSDGISRKKVKLDRDDVIKQLLKLNSSAIKMAIEAIVEYRSKTPIQNPIEFCKTVLYNEADQWEYRMQQKIDDAMLKFRSG